MKRKPSILRKPRFWLSLSVYEKVRASIGAQPAESGGMIGGDAKRSIVTDYYYDAGADSTAATYSPDTNTVNRLLEEWNADGARLMGFPHSHPRGSEEPSAGDRDYAARILAANPDLKCLLIPIIMSAADGAEFSMRLFVAQRSGDSVSIQRAQFLIFEEEESTSLVSLPSPSVHAVPSKHTSAFLLFPDLFGRPKHVRAPLPPLCLGTGTASQPTLNKSGAFQRVRAAYDLAHLARCCVVCVGVGGAGLFMEHLARAGVGRFVLIDPDVYSASNVGTQHCYLDEIGRPKVECLAARIKRIHPAAVVVAHQARLDDFDDAAFGALLRPPDGQIDPAASLLCGCTDSFPAQARVNKLSLHFGVSALFSQVYERGIAAEIVWQHLALSRACARCILSSRYRACLQPGFQNVASDGTPISSTLRLNAAEAFLALAILHHGLNHPRWRGILNRLGDRQLLQIRCDPDAEVALGFNNFSDAFAGADSRYHFTDESIWRPQSREHPDTGYPYACPDCGGSGDLRALIGTFTDTRIIPPQP